MAGYFLEVDASEVISLANQLADQIGADKAQKILDRTIYKTAKTLNVPIAKALTQVYAAPSKWIKSGFLAPRMSTGMCVIPLSGYRGLIGRVFPRMGTKNKVAVQILRGKKTPLPAKLPHQGGNPAFRSGAGVATTSASGKHPRVAGIALPQMPMPAAKGYKPTEEVIEEKMLKIMMESCKKIVGGWG